MGLVKTRRLAAMQKQQRAKAGMKGAKTCNLQAKTWKRASENKSDLFSHARRHGWEKEAK